MNLVPIFRKVVIGVAEASLDIAGAALLPGGCPILKVALKPVLTRLKERLGGEDITPHRLRRLKRLIRLLLSLQRLSFDETEGQVCYQYDKSHPKEERMDYLEFIACVTSHIPDKGQVIVRYYGFCFSAQKGEDAEINSRPCPFIDHRGRAK